SAGERSGLYYTCINSYLQPDEVAYLLENSRSKVLITSMAKLEVARKAVEMTPAITRCLVVDGPGDGGRFLNLDEAVGNLPDTPIADEALGTPMLYSSGTTGRPKGIIRPLPEAPPSDGLALFDFLVKLWRYRPDMVYLSPAPLYHAAPLGWSMAVQSMGGTVVMMERFDPEDALRFIEQYKISTAQWVPTHFVRMLKLPAEARARYDMSSLKAVFHAAAPCPVPVKEQMIAWWGPIVHEYYAGTEGNGFCIINSEEWLAHKGSVGRGLMAQVRICDEDGEALPPRAEGLVFFEGGGQFEYHGDPAKTAESRNKHGWTTLGDVGWLDEEGYLYLTDRKSFMIISGGVNIYPQELENVLIGHPKVADAAVVGAPDEEMGEKVVAVIQPMDWADAGEELRAELMAYARQHLSHVKAPRVIDFMAELPRHATGKLYKRLIRDAYWGKEGARIG
ncbi:MAG TPA: AMP-binding protein, partial [Phenylobacterium sp.]|nr:AMP-binding protein [Phenylobacterium sp.]